MGNIQRQTVAIPISKGLDEKSDIKLDGASTFLTNLNVSRPKLDVIARRNTSSWLQNFTPTGSSQSNAPRAIRPLLGSPAVIQDDEGLLPRVYPYVQGGSSASGFLRGVGQTSGSALATASVVADHWTEPLPESTSIAKAVDSCYTYFQAGGVQSVAQATVVTDGSISYITIQHYVPGADPVDLSQVPIVIAQPLNSVSSIRCFAKPISGGNGKILFVRYNGAGTSTFSVYDPTTATFINTGSTLTTDPLNVPWDARLSPDNLSFVFAYALNATTINVTKRVLSGGTTTQTIATATIASAIGVCESDSDTLRVFWGETTAKVLKQATSTISTFAAFTTAATSMAAIGGGTAFTQITAAENTVIGVGTAWVCDASASQFVAAVGYSTASLNSLPGGSFPMIIDGSTLVSKALAERAGQLCHISWTTTTQRTIFLMCARDKAFTADSQYGPGRFQVAGKTLYARGCGVLATNAPLPAFQPIPSLTYPAFVYGALNNLPSGGQCATLFLAELSSLATPRFVPILMRWMFDPIFGLASETVGGSQFFGGGSIMQHDGNGFAESGFFLAPEITLISAAGAAGFLSAGQYSVICVFAYVDSAGNIVRSAPSLPAIVTASALNTITINVTFLRHTVKWTHQTTDSIPNVFPVSIELYRTVAGGTTYFRDTTVALNNNQIVAGSPAGSITTSVSDTTIQSNQIGYWAGALNNYTPDGSGVIGAAIGRIWCADPLDQDIYRWSQTGLQGIGLQFCAEFFDRLPFGSPRGRITAFMRMDDKCIIAKRRGLWYVSGDGPTAGGTGSFTKAQPITYDIGVLNQRAWALIPQGLIFASEKGIWLLGRDLSLTYVGKDVEDTYFGTPPQDYSTIPSSQARAMLVESQNQVRFVFRSVSQIAGQTSKIAVYDYFQSTWDYHGPMASADVSKTFNVTDILSVGGKIYQSQLATDGTQEQSCVALERYDFLPEAASNGAITSLLSATIGWIKFGGIQGYERFFKILGLLRTVGTVPNDWSITVGMSYDFDPTIIDTRTFTYAQMTAGNSPPQFMVLPARPKAQAVQLTISEAFVTSGTFGWFLEDLQAEIGLLGKSARLRAEKRG